MKEVQEVHDISQQIRQSEKAKKAAISKYSVQTTETQCPGHAKAQ